MIVAVWCAYLPVRLLPAGRVVLHALPAARASADARLRGRRRACGRIRRLPAVRAGARGAAVAAGARSGRVHGGSTRRHGAFEMRAQEQKYPRAGAFVRDRAAGEAPSCSRCSTAAHPLLRRPSDDPVGSARCVEPRRGRRRRCARRARTVRGRRRRGGRRVPRASSRRRDQAAIRRLTPLAVLGDARVYAFER